MKNSYENISGIENIVRQFESCAVTPAAFDHHSHITVALWYLSQNSPQDAAARMRASLKRFLNHHNLQGYNETMTLFWMRLVESSLKRTGAKIITLSVINEILATCGESRLIYSYYSRERLLSEAAREAWIEPDLKPLDF